MGDPVTWLLILTAGATIYAADQQSSAAREQSRASERREILEQKRANAKAARARTQVLRKQRIARAQAITSTTADAGRGGSGLSGVQANIQGQGFGNIQFLNQNQRISAQISALNISSGRRISRFQSRARFGSAVAGISGDAIDIFD